MKPVQIDFSGRRPAAPWWAALLFALGAATCISAAWRVSTFNLRETRVMADVERARGAIQAKRPPPAPVVSIAEARVKAINAAIVQLNLPWQSLFGSLEEIRPKNIALLGLEPNGEKHVLRIYAETKQPEDMLDFVRLLEGQPQFASVALVKHEIYMQDPNRPFRFTIEAAWRDNL